MTLTPFRGRCHTCGHDHDADSKTWRDILGSVPASTGQAKAEAVKAASKRDPREVLKSLIRGQGWNDESRLRILEGFIESKELAEEFLGFAISVAKDESHIERREALEEVGYEFEQDCDQPGLWVWKAPTDGCDVSFASESEAVEGAWMDAMEQAMAMACIDDGQWEMLTVQEQVALIKESLVEG